MKKWFVTWDRPEYKEWAKKTRDGYFLVIIRGIFLKGIGFNEVYREVLALALIGITIFIITLSRFKKNLG